MVLSSTEYLIAVLVAFHLNHSYTVLALPSRGTLGAAFDDVSFFPSKFWDAEDRIILGYTSRPYGLSLHVLGNVSPQLGPWTLI